MEGEDSFGKSQAIFPMVSNSFKDAVYYLNMAKVQEYYARREDEQISKATIAYYSKKEVRWREVPHQFVKMRITHIMIEMLESGSDATRPFDIDKFWLESVCCPSCLEEMRKEYK
mmetsp:Transcript_2337/g.3517  ORF Transcript_2337/g.3517 Transcript_2337/m.3517 type:complete len:115 (+) Transcript_2337:786-1130(+)